VGTRPDQDSDTFPVARLKEGFNFSSARQSLNGNPVQDATHEQEKVQLKADSIEKKEIQSLLRDMGGEAEVSADDALGSKTRRLDIKDKIQKQRWWRLLSYLQMRQAIEAALEKVQALIEFHQSQMDTLAELIKEGRDRLAELLEQKSALLQEVDRFRETGRFDLDENGKFKNEKAKQALAEWEKKTGVQLDLHAPSSYLGVMEAVKDIEAEETETKSGIEKDEQDYQYHKTKRDEAIEIKNDLESDDPERRKNALERLENLECNQRVLTTENSLTSEAEISDNQKHQILRQMELTDKDLAQDGFSFKFPPLQADFNLSVLDAGKAPTNKEPEKPELKTSLPGPFMR
jgi:hypothetical protein